MLNASVKKWRSKRDGTGTPLKSVHQNVINMRPLYDIPSGNRYYFTTVVKFMVLRRGAIQYCVRKTIENYCYSIHSKVVRHRTGSQKQTICFDGRYICTTVSTKKYFCIFHRY